MKKTIKILVIVMLLAASNLSAQDVERFHRLSASSILIECNINGDSIGKLSVPIGLKFTIEDEKTEFYIIRFWNFDSTNIAETLRKSVPELRSLDASVKLPKFLQYNYNPISKRVRFFQIPKKALGFYAKPIASKYSPAFGAITTPFKFRPKGNDFTKDLSIAGMGGIKRNIDAVGRHSLTGLIGVGLSSVSLDSFNTDGKIKSSLDRSAITASIGIVYQYDRVQFGLIGGWDFLPKRSIDNWQYQGKLWVGFGVGFSIFSDETMRQKEGTN